MKKIKFGILKKLLLGSTSPPYMAFFSPAAGNRRGVAGSIAGGGFLSDPSPPIFSSPKSKTRRPPPGRRASALLRLPTLLSLLLFLSRHTPPPPPPLCAPPTLPCLPRPRHRWRHHQGSVRPDRVLGCWWRGVVAGVGGGVRGARVGLGEAQGVCGAALAQWPRVEDDRGGVLQSPVQAYFGYHRWCSLQGRIFLALFFFFWILLRFNSLFRIFCDIVNDGVYYDHWGFYRHSSRIWKGCIFMGRSITGLTIWCLEMLKLRRASEKFRWCLKSLLKAEKKGIIGCLPWQYTFIWCLSHSILSCAQYS